jgi:hypothetical protein
MNTEYEYYVRTDLSEYAGEWVAICGERVVAHGVRFESVYKEATAAHPQQTPFFALIQGEEEWLY